MQELQRKAINCGRDPEFAVAKYALLIKESLDLNAVDANGAFPTFVYGSQSDPIANTEIDTLDRTFWYVVTQSVYQSDMLFSTQKRIVLYNFLYAFNTMRGLLLNQQEHFRKYRKCFPNRGEVFA